MRIRYSFDDTCLAEALGCTPMGKVECEFEADLVEGWATLNDGSVEHIERCRAGYAAGIKPILSVVQQFAEPFRIEGVRRGHKNGNYRYDTFLGKKHTDEWKKNHSEFMKQQVGEKSSQFGSMWITNGSSNRKIKQHDTIPEGWYRGRKMRP